MNILALIPARMGSTRFPGKPLALLLGKPMIGHVYRRVEESSILTKTAVATCDQEIADYITSIGGTSIMTSDVHERASDRCGEALNILEDKDGLHYDIIVMVQGDEPIIAPDMIAEAVEPMMNDHSIEVINLLSEISHLGEFTDPNCIKVVCDLQGNALYFSREAIPSRSKIGDVPMHKQVCIIPFRRHFLTEYMKMKPTPLEITESIDMMRVLENGRKVFMVPTKYESHAVDTREDAGFVEMLLKKDSFTKRYIDSI